jgi:hypothetical protein
MVRGALLSTLLATGVFAGSLSSSAQPFEIDPHHALRMSVGHLFDRAEARERIGYLLQYWADRFGVRSEWHGDRVFLSGRLWGLDIRAVFTIQDHLVLAHAADPGTVVASRARDYVSRKLRKYLHPNYEEP